MAPILPGPRHPDHLLAGRSGALQGRGPDQLCPDPEIRHDALVTGGGGKQGGGSVARGRLGFWQRFAVLAIKPSLLVWTRRDWSGMEHIPAEGGVILAVNHLSEFDPLVVAHYVYDAGRWPQFLAKSSLFKNRIVAGVLHAVRQIPVYRGTSDAVRSLEAATAAVKAGDAVVIYPEGTTPKQGDLWPQRGKTGVARLFLDTGAPVVPIVTWGAQRIFDPRRDGHGRRVRIRPRSPITVVAGPPLDLSRWAGAPPTAANLYAITDEVMTVLRDMLAEIRGEPAPRQPRSAPNGGAG
jgi:1-acyl-sn-glycerol-3-phosphate acyltransferase